MGKKNTGNRSGGVVALIVVAVVVIGALLLLSNGGFSGSAPTSSSSSSSSYSTTVPVVHNYTLVSQGDVFSLSNGQYQEQIFSVPTGAWSISLTGSYTASDNVQVLVLTPEEYGAFTQNPSSVVSSNNYVWYSGSNKGSTLSGVGLTSGSYYIVFYYNGVFGTTVTIVNPVTLQYTT